MIYFTAALTNTLKSAAFKLAPPIKAPSMFGCAISSSMLEVLTLPPYWIRIASDTSSEYNSLITLRMNPQVSSAISGVAVFPVPIAQIGS